MTSRCKVAGVLTPVQSELLKTLFELDNQMGSDRIWKPKDLGAYRSSHHALTLKRLQDNGYVERVPLPFATKAKPNSRVNFGYRITQAGKDVWRFIKRMAQVPAHAVFGGPASRERIALLTQVTA